jgi:kynurenine formamidase
MTTENRSVHKSGNLVYYDLTHPTPMFEPLDGNATVADVSKPLADGQPICGHGQGVAIPKEPHPAAFGYFQWGCFYVDEHYATHVDSQCHFVTTAPELKIENPDRRYAHQFGLEDLIGPLVYIDISDRVEAELAKNGGQPSPDLAVTDFSHSSRATVRLEDVQAIESHITDGCFLVIHTGWEQFLVGQGPENGWYHPYNNGLNHPGVTPEVVDWLIDYEDRHGIRINGFAADNIAVESGASLLGPDGSVDTQPARINGPYLHAVGLQRGWKLVENAANLDTLSVRAQGTGTLIVGASRIVGVSGVPSRLIAMYPDS